MPLLLPRRKSGAERSCAHGVSSAVPLPTACKQLVSGSSPYIRLHPALWKAVRTSNAIKQLNREFRRHITTQTLLPCTETVPMRFWALLASGQIQMRRLDGWAHLDQPIQPFTLEGAA